MNRFCQEILMRAGTLLLCATFLLSGLLHDRLHHDDAPTAGNAGTRIVAGDHASDAVIDHCGALCPICAGLLQFFLADGQVEVPLTFAMAEELVFGLGIAPSAAPFFHQPRAPPAFSC